MTELETIYNAAKKLRDAEKEKRRVKNGDSVKSGDAIFYSQTKIKVEKARKELDEAIFQYEIKK